MAGKKSASQRRREERLAANIAKRAADKERRDRLLVIWVALGVVVVIALIAGAVGRSFDPTPAAAGTPQPTGNQLEGCTAPPAAPGTSAELKAPDPAAVVGKTYEATLTTNCGDIVATLDGTAAPLAVSSFQQLAVNNYWKDSPCHRLTTGGSLQVLQCGDPTGTGQGTPGYGFAVENAPKDGVYKRGDLVMARTADAKKGSGGQFFIVYADSTIPDPDGYSIFGTITSGMDIVDKIAEAGVGEGGSGPTDGPPSAPISILSVSVTTKKA